MAKNYIIPPVSKAGNPQASYLLEREIKDHMIKVDLIGAARSPIRLHGNLQHYYSALMDRRKGAPLLPESWEHMDYDSWIRRFRNFVS